MPTRGAVCSRRPARRSKNSAWLMTALRLSTLKGLAIRKAGSGGSPIKNRSG